MSSPRKVELQSPLPNNDANLLSLQDSFSGCILKNPGNLKCDCFVFMCGSNGITDLLDWYQENQLYITK